MRWLLAAILFLFCASIAFAADTTVTGDVGANGEQANVPCGPYWISTTVGVLVHDDSGSDINFARTTDGGATWGVTEIEAGTLEQLACWFDQETPGDTGTLLHIVWTDSTGGDDINYVNVDISDGSVSTIVDVDTTVTLSGSSLDNRIALTKAVNGDLVMAYNTGTEIEAYKSTTAGASWSSIAAPYETTTEVDYCLMFPADVDAGDVACAYWDLSASEISIKMYDSSGDSWSETSVATSMSGNTTYFNIDGAIRHSDSHLLLAAHNSPDNATDDLQTWDITLNSIASPSVSAGTNVFTNVSESAQVAVAINQQNNDVYVGYIRSPASTWLTDATVYYVVSTDDMSTWGSETTYSEGGDDVRIVSGTRTIGNDGGFIQWGFFNDDLTDIFVNLVNDVAISAAAVGGDRRIFMVQ